MNTLAAGSGRTRLCLTWQRWGHDLHVHIGGGRPHLGAVALVGRSAAGEVCEAVSVVPPHREGGLVLDAARRLHAALGGNVCVTGGVHLDDITPDEIAAVLRNAEQAAAQLVGLLQDEAGSRPAAPARPPP